MIELLRFMIFSLLQQAPQNIKFRTRGRFRRNGQFNPGEFGTLGRFP
ncbi:MAG: hypothetical protein Q8881_02765 [Sweet potato little leaf phytoplasma]|nr:hypothetical protein [Sweet potato little leaf phytoplasma]